MAADQPEWRKATREGVNLFEKERIQHESYKRAIRKKELTAAPKELIVSMKCEASKVTRKLHKCNILSKLA